MSKHKLLLSGSIIAILVMVMAILCTLPVDPKDPSNTKVNIVLRTTDKTDINFLEDTAGNRIRIGAALNLPENIDSVNLKIVYGNTIVFDTMFKDIQPTSDTLWKDIIFYTEGTRTITLTPYSSLALPSPSATIKIIGKQFPVNSAPTLIVNGNRVIKPTETCSLTIQASDSDSDQELTVFMANNPDGSQLIKNNTQFVWTAPAAFIGNDTVTFTVIDNGKPPMSASSDVIITVTATPHPPVIRVSGNFTLKPLETCSLTVSVSDEDVGQVLEIAMSGQPNGAQLVDDSIFLWTVPADFTGEKTVTFTVTDNGEPPLSSSVQATIILSAASVNSAPEWDTKTLPVPLKDTATYVKNLTDVCHDVDGDKITFTLINGTPAGDTILEATYSFVAKPALVGTYKVKIIAADPKGAADTLTIDLSVTSSTAVDVTPPTITLVAPPKDSFEVSTPTCLIDVISSDVSGIASVAATFGGTTLPMQSTAGHYTVTMGGLNAGEYNKIDLVATDASVVGNKKTLVVYIKYNPGFTITYDGNGSTGGSVPIDTVSYATGAMVTVRANSGNLVKTGTTFAGWNTAADGSGTSYAPGETFAMGSGNVTLFAKWASKKTFALTINATNGSITRVPDLPVYDSGTVVTLTPVPSSNYHFGNWSGALTGSAIPATVIMDGAKTVTAAFEMNQANSFALTVLATNGTVAKTPELSQYDSGSTVSLTATPAPGYQFSGWTGALTGNTNPASITMIGARTVTANFTIKQFALTINALNGTVVKSPDGTQFDSGSIISLTATAASGYQFSGWAGALTGNTNPASITMNGACTVTANFTAIPVILTLTNDGHGTTTPSGTASGNYNVPINISATPATGYTFSNWTVTTGGTNATFGSTTMASTTVTLTGNATIRANFIALTYTVTYDRNNGTGTVPTDNNQYTNGSTVTIKANSGRLVFGSSSFVGWSTIGGTTYSCGQQITISGNLQLFAKYSATEVMDNDGNLYTSVVIGSQTWLVENLKVTKFNDGSPLTEVTDGNSWSSLSSSAFCWYGNNSSNKTIYGALYNWYAASDSRLAPAGWKVPTRADWTALEEYCLSRGYNYDGTTERVYVGMGVLVNLIGKSLAANAWWASSTTEGAVGNDLASNNRSGFSGLPGGCRYGTGDFSQLNERGFWWTTSEVNITDANGWGLDFQFPYFTLYDASKNSGYSIRCLKQ